MEDHEIIQLFQARSEDAIGALSKKYGRLCRSLARRILGNDLDAEECVSDAFLAVWDHIPPECPNPLSAYVCRITRNLALNRYRRETAKKRDNRYNAVLEEAAAFLPGAPSAEDPLLAKELTERINLFLETINRKDRMIFVQRYWFCREISEISEELGLSKNYVCVHLHRTREKLKTYLRLEELI